MPLRALDKDGKAYLAFDYASDFHWNQLRDQRKSLGLVVPCCGNEAGLRTSKLGTRHFYHLTRGICDRPSESPEHLALKTVVAKAAQESGWSVQVEAAGESPNREIWRADVLCIKGKARVAIEIQLSHQKPTEYFRRQYLYRDSGVRGLWLHTSRETVVATKNLPAFKLSTEGETPHVMFQETTWGDERPIPLNDFVFGCLNGKLIWQQPNPDQQVTIGLLIDKREHCWKCGALISWPFEFRYPVGEYRRNFDDFEDPKPIIDLVNKWRKDWPDLAPIDIRYSNTLNTVRPSAVCPHCKALLGSGHKGGPIPETVLRAMERRVQIPLKCLRPELHPSARWVWIG